MAGDWIKMRLDLQTHPKVVRILSALRLQCDGTTSDKFRVIGGLHAVWCVFDQHTEDGRLRGYTPETMDHVVGMNGISQAMIDVGWMSFEEPETLVMVEFSEHNGQSAKRRAEDQKRKRNVRRLSASCPQKVGQGAEKKRTREEKRREEESNTHGKADASPCPQSEIVELYHERCPSLPRVQKLTPARQQAIRARWRSELPTLHDWADFFDVVSQSTFLTGGAPPNGGRSKPFLADIDFLTKQGNVVKIMEGKYDD